MKSKVETVVNVTDFSEEGEAVKGVGDHQLSGEGVGQGASTISRPTTSRRPTGVVVLRSCAVRVPPKKVQLFIEKPKSWCCVKWKKAKVIGTFGFDKQPRDDRVHIPVWTSQRSTLDVDRVLRHQDYINVRITVHLRGGRPANFYTSMDWLINQVTAERFVLHLNGKYMKTPREVAEVTVKTSQCHEKVEVDDHAVNMETEKERLTDSLDGLKQTLENKDEGVKPESDSEEAEKEKVVVNNDISQNKEEEEERWRNVVVIGGPFKGNAYQGVARMYRSAKDRLNTASSTGNTFGEMVLTSFRRVVVAILMLCFVALLVDVLWDEDALE